MDGGPAIGPRLLVQSLATDRAGNVYIGWEFGLVWRMGRDGKVTTVAGRHPDDPTCGGPPFPPCPTDGGPATSALLMHPSGLALDKRGNLYIADRDDQRVRRVTPGGTITTVAGISGKLGFSGDGGPGTRALLHSPTGVAVDAKENVYFSDR